MGQYHVGLDLDVAGASTEEIYAAMDWLVGRQDAIERSWRPNTSGPGNHRRMALFDLTSAWMTGRHCELADAATPGTAKGLPQIEYGVLTDPKAARSRCGCFRQHR